MNYPTSIFLNSDSQPTKFGVRPPKNGPIITGGELSTNIVVQEDTTPKQYWDK